MNKTVAETRQLIYELVTGLEAISGVEKILCPPFPALMAAAELVANTSIQLGAQNLHWESRGAFTGEVAPAMVAEFCQFVILGHSERRQYFGETDAGVNKKLHAALAHGLAPIVCVGESLEENQAGRTAEVVSRQTRLALEGLTSDQAARLVIAYEPVWAIGSGLAASGQGANDVIAKDVRATVAAIFGPAAAASVRVQYGGSVSAQNAAEFFSQPDIDGALVGGASLKAPEFIAIVRAAAASI